MEEKKSLIRTCISIADKKMPGLSTTIALFSLSYIVLLPFALFIQGISNACGVLTVGFTLTAFVLTGFGFGYQNLPIQRSMSVELVVLLLTYLAIPGTYYCIAVPLYEMFSIAVKFQTIAVGCLIFYPLFYLFMRNKGKQAYKHDNPPDASS